jgi:LmbE family N-acetylglucosaminyl deacetylase
MNTVVPMQIFPGVVLLISPHMDDEVLACGGTLAFLAQNNSIYLVYATDGRRSPMRLARRVPSPNPDLGAIRIQEALEAMSVLGIPEQNICFLGLPDGDLKKEIPQLIQELDGLIRSIKPDQILLPFRFDGHPDHLALNRASLQAASQQNSQPALYEYFVYHRYRLLPGGDIRKFIRQEMLFQVDIQQWSVRKKEALLRYRSQTMLFYDWQIRPILPSARVDEVSHQPEIFLKYDPGYPGSGVFHKWKTWIRLVHFSEPFLKQKKEQVLDLFNTG